MQLAVAIRRAAGGILLAVGCAGVFHAARASAAQWLYGAVRYGRERPFHETLRMASLASRIYPWNFYLCAWVAESAFGGSPGAEPGERAALRAAAGRWCARSLELNPYKRNMNVLNARLLEAGSPAGAVEFWRRYVELQYWSRYNHALLAELCAAAGEFAEAARELEMARGGPGFDDARARVMAAWEKEKRQPVQVRAQGKGTRE